MLRKFFPSVVITILLLSTGLISCNQHLNNGDNGVISFDTARAAQSVIPIQEAIAFQRSFIRTRSELSKLTNDTSYLLQNFNLPNGEAFTKDALLLLLNQKDADGVRFYYGKDTKGVVRLVLLPVTKDGKVIYTKLIGSSRSVTGLDSSVTGVKAKALNAGNNDEAVETGQTCPPCLIDPQQP